MKKARTEKDSIQAEALLKKSYSALDKAAQKNIIHPHKAARHKAQLAKIVGSLTKTESKEEVETS